MTRIRRLVRAVLATTLAFASALLAGYYVYNVVVADRGMEYYGRRPWMLLFPVAIACSIGLSVWLVSRLSAKWRKRIVILAWGAGNLAGMALLGWWIYMAFAVVQLESSVEGRLVTENASGSHVKYVAAAFVVMLVAFLVLSWGRLIHFSSEANPDPSREQVSGPDMG